MLKRWVVVLSFAAALAIATGAALSQRTTQSPAPVAVAAPRGANPEGQEEDEVTAERLEALAEARARGLFGAKAAPTTSPAPGWVGSRLLNATADDWESLEQIHGHVVRFSTAVAPRRVAEEIIRLIRSGHFECQPAAPSDVDAILAEPAEYWFRMTESGRAWWASEGPQADGAG